MWRRMRKAHRKCQSRVWGALQRRSHRGKYPARREGKRASPENGRHRLPTAGCTLRSAGKGTCGNAGTCSVQVGAQDVMDPLKWWAFSVDCNRQEYRESVPAGSGITGTETASTWPAPGSPGAGDSELVALPLPELFARFCFCFGGASSPLLEGALFVEAGWDWGPGCGGSCEGVG